MSMFQMTKKCGLNDFTLKNIIKQQLTFITDLFTFKIIPCILIGLIILKVLACKINNVLKDLFDSCVTGKCNHIGVHAL